MYSLEKTLYKELCRGGLSQSASPTTWVLWLYLRAYNEVHPHASHTPIKRESPSPLMSLESEEQASIYVDRENNSSSLCECFICVCDGTPTDLTLLSRLTWQRRLHDSHSEDRWQGLTPPSNPLTHTQTYRRDAQHKNFLGTHRLVSQSNNDSSIASSLSPSVCVCVCEIGWQYALINYLKSASQTSAPAALF